MIPILYEGTETEFTSQGLGSLSDATSCTISEEINNTYELEMKYPMTGVHFFDIKVGRIILATPAPRKESEPFSIYKISKPIDGIVTIYAEHISYRLSYIPVKPFSASNCYGALNGCVENSLEDNPFTVWTDKALNINFSFTKPQSFRLCLGGVEGSILDTYRGEYEFNRFTVKLHTNRGSLKDTAKIIYGKNLTDLKQEESIENTVTGIVPYWCSTVTQANDEGTSTSESVEVVVTLPEYVLESEYADKFPYRRTAVVDLSEYFKEQPTVDELRTRANQYMKDNLTGLPAVSLTVSFIDLARSEENKDFASEIVYLGDQVPVYFENLGIAAKAEITSAIYDVLADRYDSLTLGTVSSSLSKTLNEISKKQDTAVTQTNLQSALILAQKVMAGGAGGYIVTKYFNGHPSETYYGDTDNVDTMVNVIRINKNGIAFSNSGISGPYVSAWTIDGKFNADFIQAGKISGSFIEANSITVGKLSDEVQADISNAKDGAEKANNSIIDLQKQIDGVIESWSADPVPTLTNYPASSWTTNEDKEKHIGDLYYDKSNKCYRFMQNSDGSFSWKLIADTDVTKAIADAQKALDATDQSVTGVTTEYYASTSATELKGGSWSEDRPTWTETNYIWSRTKTTTKAGITTYSSPSCIQGNSGTDGKDGISPTVAISKSDGSTTITITDKNGTHSQTVKDGVNGTPGATGADGKTSYFHVKYSNDGGKTFTPNNGEEVGAYIGTYSDFKIEDSTSVSAYTWAKIQGEQGKNATYITVSGSNYDASYISANTTYLIINGKKYNYSPTRGHTLAIVNPANGAVESIRTYDTYNDNALMDAALSSVPTGKIICLFSADATGMTSEARDALIACGSAINNTWGSARITHVFIGMKGLARGNAYETWATGSDGTRTLTAYYTPSGIVLNGQVGANGQNGSDGRGIKSTEITYQAWTDGISTPTGEWSNTIPDTSVEKPFLWTKTKVTYSDDTTSTSYNVGSTLKGVNVGGRNLAKWTSTGANWDASSFDKNTRTFTRENTGTDEKFIGLFGETSLIPGNTYIFSATIWSNGNVASCEMVVYSLNAVTVRSRFISRSELTTNPQRFELLFTIPNDSTGWDSTTIRFDNNSTTSEGTTAILYVKDVKLELGNIATDWTPAPEDVDSDISNAQTTANSAKTNASTAQQSANDAQSTANDALNKANSAQASANSAIKFYQDAINKAKDAQISADRATELANGAQQGVSNIEQVVKIDTQGVRIYEKENSKNYVHQKSDGSHFYTNNAENGVLGPDSRMNNLAVNDYFMSASHRMEYGNVLNQDASVFYHIGKLKKVVQ